MTDDPVYPEEYYEHIARTMGQAAADWARLPRAERERELSKLHAMFNTPDDLSIWPPELGGDPELPLPDEGPPSPANERR